MMANLFINPLPPSWTIQISGISFHLTERLDHPFLVKLIVDGTDVISVLFKRREIGVGMRSLQKPRILHGGSTLTVRVQEKHRDRSDETLAHFNLSLADIWRGQDSGTPESQKHQIHLIDPKKQLWLNIDVVRRPYNAQDIHASAPFTQLPSTSQTTRENDAAEIEIGRAVGSHSPIGLQDLKELEHHLLSGIKTVDPRATECIPGTRTKILADVAIKVDEDHDINMIWIRGAPGSGKSSISLSSKSQLRGQGQLVTYFRFDRNEASITTSVALWRLVAYHLARRLPLIRTQMLKQLRDDTIDLDSSMDVFTSLVESPLSKLTHILRLIVPSLLSSMPWTNVVALRAICPKTALRRWSRLPKYFKLLITSREEGDLARVLSSISTPIDIPSGHFLTENPKSEPSIDASNDIRTYLEGRFRRVRDRIPLLPKDWPGTNTTTEMVCRAAGIFMWATTATNFIDCRGIDPQDRLDKVMRYTPEPNSMKPLYSLYIAILDTAFGDIVNGELEAELQTLRFVLGAMVISKRPLHDTEFIKLPTTNPVTDVTMYSIRDGLRSVVAPGSGLRFTHKSFDDFLMSTECPIKYRIRMDESQHLLTQLCITTMEERLHFNMCGLETSCSRNVDVPDIQTKVTNGISTLLSYSCCFWADHLSLTPFDEALMGGVSKMILDKLLYWFEVMSLLKEMNRVSHSLLLLLKWSHPSPDDEFQEFVRDARLFIGAFIHPITQSAPHIYISALAFSPEHSLVARNFLPRFPRVLALSKGRPINWSPCIFVSPYHKTHRINSVAFSPDEKFFASGSNIEIYICDSETGNLVSGPYIPDPSPSCDIIQGVFFDLDGRHLWASQSGGHVIAWDIETGDKHLDFRCSGEQLVGFGRFDGSQKLISSSRQLGRLTLRSADTGEKGDDLWWLPDGGYDSISMSPDGHYLAYAINDTIRIMKLGDVSEIRGSSFTHTSQICALSFSTDGSFLVSGSIDGTIMIWDVRTSDIVVPPLAVEKVQMEAVAYFHKSHLIVAASGHTVMVWNAFTHEAVLEPLTAGSRISLITALTLSRDGRRALTATSDGTVKMWDLGRKGVVPATQDHRGAVWCVTFSPCGQRLASVGADKTIQIWNVNTGEALLDPIIIPIESYSIIFSPDGSKIIAHNSEDGIVRMWNVETGELISHHNFNHHNWEYLSFRPIDQRFVMYSKNGPLCTWSLEGDVMIEDSSPLWPCTGESVIALSPDGLTAIVRDRHINPVHRVWSTTMHQPLPVDLADNMYIPGYSVVFSPSGLFLVAAFHSSQSSSALRVWNTRTGKLVAGPSTFGGKIGHLAFSPNDRHVAFAWCGDAVWAFDAHHDRLVPGGPWRGHTDNISTLAFSLDGGKLVSCSEDGQIRIWNTTILLGDTQVPAGFLGVETSMEDGWVMDGDGNILFWMPKDHRERLFWPGTVTIIGGTGITTELDLSRFRNGGNWTQCFIGK